MKRFIYCDESGESSFSEITAFKFFSVCTMTIEETKRKKIRNTMRKKSAKLYRLGWPRELEIKATNLHNLKNNKEIPQAVKNLIDGDKFIEEILFSVKHACQPRIDYIVVNKDGIKDPSFRSSPYGITYNFFAGKVLVPLILEIKDCFLTVDKRNKEMHNQKHFDGYIETRVRGDAFEKGIDLELEIKHDDSQTNYGLQAVDFFSWSIYRTIARNDERFFRIFKDLVKIGEKWYC